MEEKKKIITVSISDPLSKVVRLMVDNNISHIPVCYYENIEGVISKTTIADYLASLLLTKKNVDLRKAFEETEASKIMTRPVTQIESDQFSIEIVNKLIHERVGSALIVQDNRPIGIVTKTDVLYAFRSYLEKNNKVNYFSNFIKNWLYEKGIVQFAASIGEVGI